jgi:alkylhydroperoxidase/carboxymuconolactone decarboxylase family protein YurZ
MSDQSTLISKVFQTFMSEAPQHAQAWVTMVQGLASASALDKKTAELAYLAGASREEDINAILVGSPAAGHRVTQALLAAIAAYDAG